MGRRPRFQAGLALEQALSKELEQMGIPHELTRGKEENIEERVDLKIFPPPHAAHEPTFELQLTLRKGCVRKMRDFVVSALLNNERGIRVYLEIQASKHRAIKYIATRVAQGIKTIIHRFKNFGRDNLFGVTLRIGRSRRDPPLSRFDLMEIVGERAKKLVARELRKRHLKAQRERADRMRKILDIARSLRTARRDLFPQPVLATPRRIAPTRTPYGHHGHRGFRPIRQPR